MTITLLGEPKSTNSIYRSVCMGKFPRVYMSHEGKALKESYQWQAKSQWKKKTTDKPVAVHITLFFKNGHKHDIDNFGKLLLDSLTDIVWVDDSQIAQMTVIKMMDKARPRIEINITEL